MTIWVLVTDGVPSQWFTDEKDGLRALATARSGKDRSELWPVDGE